MIKRLMNLFVFLNVLVLMACHEAERTNLDNLIDVFNNDIEFTVFDYGERIEFSTLRHETMSDLDDIDFEGHGYNFIVINNLGGTITLHEEELQRLKTEIDEHDFFFYYLGTTQLSLFYNLGYLEQEVLDPSSLSFGYVLENNARINSYGIWTTSSNEAQKENELLMVEMLLVNFKYDIEHSMYV